MILKSDLIKIAELQAEALNAREPGLKREALGAMPALARHALIITGIRRCGKSTLLSQMISEKYPDAFFLNFDDNRLYGFENSDLRKLDEIISESGKKTLFFDELQEIEGWERYVRQKLDENYKVVITGSNASLMSMELSVKLTGRYLSRELFPFSFTEFIKFTKMKPGEKAFLEYMKKGGFPEYLKTGQQEILSLLFDDIITRDIVVRYGIRDVKSLQRVALYLVSNIARPVTGTKLRQPMGIASTSTIMEYFSFLESSYLFSFVQRFSYSAKARLINPRKVYSVDPGFVSENAVAFSEDEGYKFENVVFNYLRSQNREIWYFNEKNECDFICRDKKGKFNAIQACLNLTSDNTDRELAGLFESMRFFKLKEGVIVTLGQKDKFTSGNLTAFIVPASEFLSRNIKQPR